LLAVTYDGPRDVKVREVPAPRMTKSRLLIEMANASICGTDLHFYRGEWRAKKGIILGHDASGKIGGTDERVALEFMTWCGACDFCRRRKENLCAHLRFMGFHRNGFFAEKILLPSQNTYLLPDTINDEEGACLEPVALAVHTLNNLNPKPKDWVTVLGQGAVGLCMTQVARARGCRVIAIDFYDYRLRLAEKFGADHAVNAREESVEKAVRSATGVGSHFVIEAAGSRRTVEQTQRLVRAGGRVALVGAFIGEIEFKDEALFSGINAYTISEKKQALRMVANGSIDVKSMITHRFPLSDFRGAIRTALDPSKRAVKILVHP
jgi:threonine dehydrogenase-like Zn-dependent dehydrogenase